MLAASILIFSTDWGQGQWLKIRVWAGNAVNLVSSLISFELRFLIYKTTGVLGSDRSIRGALKYSKSITFSDREDATAK